MLEASCVAHAREPIQIMTFPLTHPALARALAARDYSVPTAVQIAVLEDQAAGRDLLVSAQTGSGKTVAFGLAMATTLLGEEERFARAGEPMALIIAPTRELALQVQRELTWLYAETGARVVRDAQTINLALGYEMNTIEFAIKDGVPYAIDYLNPAPDFERDRITPFYFDMVVEKMANLVIDRALNGHPSQCWPRWEEMLGIGPSTGFTGAPAAR